MDIVSPRLTSASLLEIQIGNKMVLFCFDGRVSCPMFDEFPMFHWIAFQMFTFLNCHGDQILKQSRGNIPNTTIMPQVKVKADY